MVYRKRRTFRKKKPAWYNKKYNAMQIAGKALAGVKYLKGLVNSEMLHKDNVLTLGASASNIYHLTGIAQGDTDAGRTGNSLLARNIYIRGLIEVSAAVTLDSRVLLALVCDTQQIGDTTPAIADIFASPTSTETLLNLSESGRFKVLWRKTYMVTPATGGRPAIEVNKYWKVYKHVRYNGTASTDIQKNGYYFVVITSEAVNFPTVVINTRLGYHDN